MSRYRYILFIFIMINKIPYMYCVIDVIFFLIDVIFPYLMQFFP